MRDHELFDFQTRLFKDPWSTMKAMKMVVQFRTYLKSYNVTHVALAIPHLHYQNKETKELIVHIKTCCRLKRIPVSLYAPDAFTSLHSNARAKKKAMMRQLAEMYPELLPLYKKELKNKRRYFFKLFEAVAAVSILNQEMIK